MQWDFSCWLPRFFRRGALQQWVTTAGIIVRGMAAVIAMTVTGIATIGAIGIAMTGGTATSIETTTAATEATCRRFESCYCGLAHPAIPLAGKVRLKTN